jgi:metacaspase-1
MSKGIALHIGLNSVDPRHYQGWAGELAACELDAGDMALIAKSRGFASTLLLTKEATRKAVSAAMTIAAGSLKSGDIFFLTYSGHGGQVPDVDGDESDGLDETWCLFDAQLIDDEIFSSLGAFAAGVRILVLSDSCHSGTVLKDAVITAAAEDPAIRYRAMPPDVVQRTYLANKDFYDQIGTDPSHRNAQENVKASALLISGCQDNQLSADGAFNGRFTGALKNIWNGGKFRGDYRRFYRGIVAKMPRDQTPNYFTVGKHNQTFEAQQPFTV